MNQTPFKGAKFYENNSSPLGLVFLHAYTGTPNDFNLIARQLNREEGYEILSPLFKGHGTANVSDLFEASPEDWVQEAAEAIYWMRQRHEDVLVFGLSMGGIITTQMLAENQGDVRGGGVFNSPVLTKKPVDVTRFFKQYAQAIYKRNQGLEAYQADEAELVAKHQAQMADLEDFKAHLQPKLKQITQPFFLAQSGQDEMIDASDASLLKQALENADVQSHWYPDNTHVITVNRNRDAFVEDLTAFIQSFI
ncbi:hypothetical protein CL176_03515 [Suicoccus acidiformans]|uniref:Serine aminopeptidase S33 domain-containing protein n=1 Tax=Suicoccus acidiformans TaxID=2036206 RepID=A0A347WJB7_9LACT|nr:alpha/beta fold hydrolase [Suicoccus acidiformans]AXY25174.1 hypothetical protein CL176_03515 [Suicoccus acidiformans]